MSDLDSIKSALKKLSPADREEISRLTGLDLGEDGSSNPLESKPHKFYWISFLVLSCKIKRYKIVVIPECFYRGYGL